MRILQVTHKLPHPPLDGGSIVIDSLTTGLLAAGHQVKVVSIISPKRNVKASEIPKAYVEAVNLETVLVDTRLKIVDAFLNLFTGESYHISRFINTAFSEKLKSVLTKEVFDVIQLESIFVLPYIDLIRQYSKAKIILRTQNIEHLVWEGLTKNEKNWMKKSYLTLLTKRLKKFELENIVNADAIIAITKVDEKYIRQALSAHPKITTIPFGISLEKFINHPPKKIIPNSVFHLGSMDWFPNAEAVDWFLEKVWNDFDRKAEIKLYLAGKFMPEKLLKLNNEHLIIEGTISRPLEYMSNKQIMIVPLWSGSGIRVKIIEGMALGKVVIATTIGAQGIECTPNENIIIADSPEEFKTSLLKCIEDEHFCHKISENAKQFIYQNYSNEAITKRFLAFYRA